MDWCICWLSGKKLHCKMLGGYLVLIVQASIIAQLGRWGSFYAFPIAPEIIYEGHNHPASLIHRNILSVEHLHNFFFHVVGRPLSNFKLHL